MSAFHPLRDEPDTLPLLTALAAEGFATALPVVVGRGSPLTFRLWRPGEPTRAGAMSIREPLEATPVVDPDLLFVPLACFDRRGHRIGYGAGFYDRTLARLRAMKPVHAVGVAYGVCEVAAVPYETHDQSLDAVVTEQRNHSLQRAMIRLLFIGDVVGRSGRAAVLEQVPLLRGPLGARFRHRQRRERGGRLRPHRERFSRSSSPWASTR